VLESFAARWQSHHGGVGIDANIWVRSWLALVVGPAKLLAAWRVSPSLLTFIGLGFSLATIWVASTGVSRGVLVGCALLVLASAYFDGLDGAVAILSDRVSDFGSRFDRVCDRLSEVSWLLMFLILGVPVWAAVAALCAAFFYEWARWRAGKAGQLRVGLVTVGERPVRVAIVVMFLLGAAVLFDWNQGLLLVGVVAWVVVCVMGALQVSRGF